MLSNLKIGTRLLVSFGVVLLFIVTIAIASYYGMEKLKFYINDLANNHGSLMENAQRTLHKQLIRLAKGMLKAWEAWLQVRHTEH